MNEDLITTIIARCEQGATTEELLDSFRGHEPLVREIASLFEALHAEKNAVVPDKALLARVLAALPAPSVTHATNARYDTREGTKGRLSSIQKLRILVDHLVVGPRVLVPVGGLVVLLLVMTFAGSAIRREKRASVNPEAPSLAQQEEASRAGIAANPAAPPLAADGKSARETIILAPQALTAAPSAADAPPANEGLLATVTPEEEALEAGEPADASFADYDYQELNDLSQTPNELIP